MNETTKSAVLKAIAKEYETISAEIGTVEFRGQVVFDVDITVKRGEDILYTPTADIPLIPVLAVVFRRMGFQREKMAELLIEAVNEVSKGDKSSIADAITATAAELAKIKAIMKEGLDKKTKAGPTTVKGIVRLNNLIPHNQPVIEFSSSPKTAADSLINQGVNHAIIE